MLSKKKRLLLQTTIGKRGRVYRRDVITIKILPSTTSHSRFGVSVSKRVAPTAVERNRIKRMVFAALEKRYAEWPRADYVITVQSPCSQYTQAQINEQLIPSNIS